MGTIEQYFSGSISQHIKRAQDLLAEIPSDLPREFHILAQECTKQLELAIEELEFLLSDPAINQPVLQAERLRRFRRVTRTIGFIETTGITALDRQSPKDVFLNQLIQEIKVEIAYPMLPPTVVSMSSSYFEIELNLHLMFVPLNEGSFLLHLPDLYHELAHPLLSSTAHPRIQQFQIQYFKAHSLIAEYILTEKHRERKAISPRAFSYYLNWWENAWNVNWLVEFFCDLFATYTLGPAFVWSHVHLFAKQGADPFDVLSPGRVSHPCDDARFRAMETGLKLIGFKAEAKQIRIVWDQFVALSGYHPKHEYDRCFPQSIIETLATSALEGIRNMGCNIATKDENSPIGNLLNRAWDKFWSDPLDYPGWEQTTIEMIKENIALAAI